MKRFDSAYCVRGPQRFGSSTRAAKKSRLQVHHVRPQIRRLGTPEPIRQQKRRAIATSNLKPAPEANGSLRQHPAVTATDTNVPSDRFQFGLRWLGGIIADGEHLCRGESQRNHRQILASAR